MPRKPTVGDIRRYLNTYDPFGLGGARVQVVGERNHLIYRLTKEGNIYALRMINPESRRVSEWISMREEYEILKALEPAGVGPKVFWLDEELFGLPLLIQEFVTAACYNDLRPLSEAHLKAAARAIATVNAQYITPERFPFMEKYVEKSYRWRLSVWISRLVATVARSRRYDVAKWAAKIAPLTVRATVILARSKSLLPKDQLTFHYDGCHCGNTYYREGRTIFLDWEKVSLRKDPSFSLVRFATSIEKNRAVPPQLAMEVLIREYLNARPELDIAGSSFTNMVLVRLLERAVSDLVWVLREVTRHPQRRYDPRPVEELTNLAPRYQEVVELLKRPGL